MNSTSLYLKYRPFQLDDVVGHKHIVATLRRASEQNLFAHAYLFSGNRGCGKTTSARIAANLMTCENIQNGKLCGKCRACTTIHNGSSLDVRELDGAKNGKVEHIQELIDGAQWPPQELKRKVYIIDEAHQLTDKAISALLKIVEEPPPYLTFIFCTTEIKKILPTILSRCQRFNFNKISSKDIVERLSYIASNEHISIEPGALLLLSKLSRGSMRDAISYLEQIGTVAAGKNITEKASHQYFGSVDQSGILNIIKSIFNGNVSLLLDQINDLVITSADPKEIMFYISEMLRNIMLIKVQGDKSALLDLSDNEISELSKIGEMVKLSQLLKMSSFFADIEKKIEFNINDRWVMETTLINCIASLRKES